jgi:arylmalonate decarboxylase
MNGSRRKFLKATGIGLAGATLGRSADPTLGLIFPVTRPVPPEGLAMYPSGVRFITAGLELKTMTPEGYDAVLGSIPAAAEKLAAQGASAVVLMGTSLSFYKGAAFNQRLTETLKKATGLPATTMSTAVIEGLKAVGAKRVVAATAYDSEVNRRLQAFLTESGFGVLGVKGLGIEKVEDIGRVTQDGLLKFCAGVRATQPEANAILVSCGGLRTLEILAPLEQQCRIPAVSSTPHALWAGVRLLGLSGRAPGFGTLLSKTIEPRPSELRPNEPRPNEPRP